MKKTFFSVGIALFWVSCAGEPKGLAPTVDTGGARIVFDLQAEDMAEIPMPNDVATRHDPTSPTGLRLNISTVAKTSMEQDLREKANTLDGFGIYSPIWVRFDAPLDLENIIQRQHNEDIEDDCIYVLRLSGGGDFRSRFLPLDFGNGNFPIVLERIGDRNMYFENDPRLDASNILFDTYDEDTNKNGLLDPGEDTDMDYVLDSPNVLKEGGNVVDDLATFYERETNTLIFRPIVTLEEGTKYAVVITKRLVDKNKNPVVSPFPYVNHLDQTEELQVLRQIPNLPFNIEDIAFAWVFTTGNPTREIRAIRDGLYGHGVFRALNDMFPTDAIQLDKVGLRNSEKPYILSPQPLIELIRSVPDIFGSSEELRNLLKDFENIDFLIAGSFKSPNFLVDKDGIATEHYPADDDETIEVDPETGRMIVGTAWVTFICAVPKKLEGKQTKPFPVVLVGHGYTGNRLEFLLYSGRVARFGMATCGLDAFGHGMTDIRQLSSELPKYAEALGLEDFVKAISKGRARDLDNDGKPDSGGDFWTKDIFHTRDVVRQTLIDYLQFVRILRSFDGKRRWSLGDTYEGVGSIAGDFDGDGVVDLGGDGDKYFATGGSLGGIISGALCGIEPALAGCAPIAGGAGLVDIAVRSTQGGVPEAVFLPLFGPLIVGNPSEDGRTEIKFLVNNVNNQGHYPFAVVEGIKDGDVVRVQNLKNGEVSEALVMNSRFRVGIASDALTATERRPFLGIGDEPIKDPIPPPRAFLFGDPLVLTVLDGQTRKEKLRIDKFMKDLVFQGTLYKEGSPLEAISAGFGLQRNTPKLRRLLSISAFLIEPGDPAVYAPHIFQKPFEYPYEKDLIFGANPLMIPTVGDMNVPVNTGIAMARLAGIIDMKEKRFCFDPEKPIGDASACETFKGCDAPEGCKDKDSCAKQECKDTGFCANVACCTGQLEYSNFYKDLRGQCISENEALIKFHVVEGIERFRRFAFYPFCDCRPILFDPDNLSQGTDGFFAPTLDTPIRATKRTDSGIAMMRLPYVSPRGTHGFGLPDFTKPFPVDNYMLNLIGHFFATFGNPKKTDDLCFASVEGCDFF
jgi:hypothetical protein